MTRHTGDSPRVAFVTAADLRDLDADPVLERTDYWEADA